MRIGQVAERLAIKPTTIRYYESLRLIPEPSRTESGYRDYAEEEVDRIRFVTTARRLDLTLNEIRGILAVADRNDTPCGHVRAVVARKAHRLDRRIAEMTRLRDALLAIEQAAAMPSPPGCVCPLIVSGD